jgi:hypothetical protein
VFLRPRWVYDSSVLFMFLFLCCYKASLLATELLRDIVFFVIYLMPSAWMQFTLAAFNLYMEFLKCEDSFWISIKLFCTQRFQIGTLLISSMVDLAQTV